MKPTEVIKINGFFGNCLIKNRLETFSVDVFKFCLSHLKNWVNNNLILFYILSRRISIK